MATSIAAHRRLFIAVPIALLGGAALSATVATGSPPAHAGAAVASSAAAGASTVTLPPAVRAPAWSVYPGASGGNSVSCVSAVWCMAVGAPGPSVFTNAGSSVTPQDRAERWDGTSWITMPTATVANTQVNLSGISCRSPWSCIAVGDATEQAWSGTTTSEALVEKYDGISWSVVPQPSDAVHGTSGLSAVSCSSPTACVAVGASDLQPSGVLVEAWDGAALRTLAQPAESTPMSLDSVSCPTPTWCAVIGERTAGSPQGVQVPVTEHVTGSTITIDPQAPIPPLPGIPPVPPLPPAAPPVDLVAVSCAAPDNCLAVGSAEETVGWTSFSWIPFAESWDGTTWSESLPTSTQAEGDLSAVSCVAGGTCIATGEQSDASAPAPGIEPPPPTPLTEALVGSSWATAPAPATEGTLQALRGQTLAAVSCPTTSFCVAVGPGAVEMTLSGPAPVVTSVQPNWGAVSGGSTLVIRGRNLLGTIGVAIGPIPLTKFWAVSDTEILATTPNCTQCLMPPSPTSGWTSPNEPVLVTTHHGTSQPTPADMFTWEQTNPPTVTAVLPSSGSPAGGSIVTIVGTGFTNGLPGYTDGLAAVTFAGHPAYFTVENDTRATAIVPAGARGQAPVIVTLHNGEKSAPSRAATYTYVPGFPEVTAISPTKGTPGDLVTVHGQNLSAALAVRFGNQLAPIVRRSPAAVEVRAPQLTGTVPVSVMTPVGTSGPGFGSFYTSS